MSEVILAFGLIGAIFAYLAVNIPDKHGALQIFHLLMTHVVIFFTGYLAYTFTASNESPVGLLISWNNSYYAIIGLVFAYIIIFILDVMFLNLGVFGNENEDINTGSMED